MMMYLKVLSALLALVGTAHACSLSDEWQSQSIEKRASKPKFVLYGTVVSDQFPPPGSGDVPDQIYWVVVQPLCWLKRDPEVDFQPNDRTKRETDNEHITNTTDHYDEFENITVAQQSPCTYNNLVQGKKYIMFLSPGSYFSNFTINDVNTEPGVFKEPPDETFEAVHRGIDAGLKAGYPDGECLEGVDVPCFTGERNPEVCNGGVTVGVTVGVALWFFILAIALAVSVY